MVQNCAVQDDIECCQMVQDYERCCQIVQDGEGGCQIGHGCARLYVGIWNGTWKCKMMQNGWREGGVGAKGTLF